ncbi:MAG: PHB depolymerase family esterase [Thermoguttaceae bacterium]|jgi:polyhydroxybutyrate depolymerase
MNALYLPLIALLATAAQPLGPGDHQRLMKIGDMTRCYWVHVPPQHKLPPQAAADRATPVLLALHGAAMTAGKMADFSGLDQKADEAGFVVVYPEGTGFGGLLLTWNADARADEPDDTAFISRVLDDLENVVRVDRKRVYATGMSNGGMMCYRLAAELSDRIAAIAPVAGTLALEKCAPRRPVPVIHFHGTADQLVPPGGIAANASRSGPFPFKSLDETIRIWAQIDGCPGKPRIVRLPDTAKDGTTVIERIYGPGRQGAEVILYLIEGGGHTWPGRQPRLEIIGKSTRQISANDLMWDFFQRHPLK